MRWLVVLLALAAACGDDNGKSDGGDGGMDMAAPAGCPATNPGHVACTTPRLACTYPDAYCVCDAMSGDWYCSAPSCATAVGGHACTSPGQVCVYGAQTQLICVGPENVWVMCGAFPLCYTNGLCCAGADGTCVTLSGANCGCSSNHVASNCGPDGGA